ncbi:MAG TPA: H-NS histone family protein [Paenalcaligenes sp.]|nr:H-NS histone family protein [Paenalcaligenes sp.]
MPLEHFTAEKEKIEKEIQKLQRKMHSLKTRQRRPVMNTIVRSMIEYEITPEEIERLYKRQVERAKRGGRSKLPPRYQNPETGVTWSGRGRPPKWIVEAEAQGRSRDEFLIEKPAKK